MGHHPLAASGAPAIKLTLVGAGEPLLRMEKRLACAAKSLGLTIDTEVCKSPEAMGIPYNKTPAILVDGQMGLAGLRRTEEIEAWLRERFLQAPNTNTPAPTGK
jgi:hypothetical protein